jgi:predicted RNA-binding Zn-ribbon protein involved in translation (DUF1610 family)
MAKEQFKCPKCGSELIEAIIWSQEGLTVTMDADGEDYNEHRSGLYDTVWSGKYSCASCNKDISKEARACRNLVIDHRDLEEEADLYRAIKPQLEWIVEYFDEHPHLIPDKESAESCWLDNAKKALRGGN